MNLCKQKTGNFPDIFKIAKVRPCNTEGSKSGIDNYRPISNILFFSKVFKTVIKNRLVGFIESYEINC